MNPYRHFIQEFVRLSREVRGYPVGKLDFPPRRALAPAAPRVLIFSPHPDDESITGGLALRLLRERHWRVVNVAVTLGAKPERRPERLMELKDACRFLGFALQQTGPGGLENVNAATRADDPKRWARSVASIVRILRRHRPKVIFFPHESDWHSTHIGVHWLVMDALPQIPDLDCYLVETEFWGQMASPNLMVEYTSDDVADLVAATSFHVGEVKRNPYHLRLPAWMQDNVRRGAELVGGQGRKAPDFVFAQLFRLRRRQAGQIKEYDEGRLLSASSNVGVLFP